MSYADPTQPSAPGSPPSRPMVVTASSWLLWLTAVLFILPALVSLAYIGTYSDVYQQAYAGTDAEGTEAVSVGIAAASSVFFILFGVGFALLGYFNSRGRNGSRITTWVLGGLALCCSGVGLVLSGLASGMEGMQAEGAPDPAEVERMLSDALPGWFGPLNLVASIVGTLALLAVLVLLALPPANEFFRKRPEDEDFEPPPPAYPPASQ
ncbi:MAG TPA: hypothetical protein VKZ74_00560 [Natronosporangium sp.]|nr:hypothetical protein [Natronosporangium sp.]